MASAASSLINKTRFNEEAAAWDGNPFVHAMSAEAWKAIQKHVPYFNSTGDSSNPNVLEIGCGTGLLSVMVAPKVNKVVAVDAANGMIDVLKAKLNKPGAPANIIPVCVLLQDPEDTSLPPADPTQPDGPRLKYDLITSHMVLHHIPDLAPVLRTLLGCLKGGGMVALTDFEDFGPEAKRFHPEAKLEGVYRHGINQVWMADLMREVGFIDVQVEVAWRSEKRVEKYPGEFRVAPDARGGERGELMEFSYLICMGRKPEIL